MGGLHKLGSCRILMVRYGAYVVLGKMEIYQVVQCSYFIIQLLKHDPLDCHVFPLREPAVALDTNVAMRTQQSCEYISCFSETKRLHW